MKRNELQNLVDTKVIKKGKWCKAEWQSISDNGYKKLTKGFVRFVKHQNTKEYKETHANGQTPALRANPNIQVIIPDILIHNVKTGNDLLCCHTTPMKAEVKYFDQMNNEITKAEYEANVPTKKTTPTNVFQKKLQDIISIG